MSIFYLLAMKTISYFSYLNMSLFGCQTLTCNKNMNCIIITKSHFVQVNGIQCENFDKSCVNYIDKF